MAGDTGETRRPDVARIAMIAVAAFLSLLGAIRYGVHAERGTESFELLFRMLAGHDRFHLDQARRTLEAVRAR